jgi:hypothetical protein
MLRGATGQRALGPSVVLHTRDTLSVENVSRVCDGTEVVVASTPTV